MTGFVVASSEYKTSTNMVGDKWSACSPSSQEIRVRIPPKSTVLILWTDCKERKLTKGGHGWQFFSKTVPTSTALMEHILIWYNMNNFLRSKISWAGARSSGYGRRLTFQSAWVRIPVPDRYWMDKKISCKRLIKIEISEKKVFKVVKRFRATFDHMMWGDLHSKCTLLFLAETTVHNQMSGA